MATYAIGDRVQVAESLGGWIGYVTDLVGGPIQSAFRVTRPYDESEEQGEAVLQDVEIIDGPLPVPTFQVGEAVVIGGVAGLITEIAPNGVHEVVIDRPVSEDLDTTRTHWLPHWRVAIENNRPAEE